MAKAFEAVHNTGEYPKGWRMNEIDVIDVLGENVKLPTAPLSAQYHTPGYSLLTLSVSLALAALASCEQGDENYVNYRLIDASQNWLE